MYSLNTAILAETLLPPHRRKPRLLALVKVLLTGIAYAHTQLLAYIAATRDSLAFNGQVMYLLHILRRDVADAIDIVDNDKLIRSYIYATAEVKPDSYIFATTGSDELFLYNAIEYITDADFEVIAPTGTTVEQANKINFIVNKYRAAGKKYKLTTISFEA